MKRILILLLASCISFSAFAQTKLGITSNWVKVEVQKGAKDKDGNPIKYAVAGRCLAGYLKESISKN